mmetsp:Transcript_6064/g.9673  ORF Transcript_6064/g.9673 Transcript_6064/m.9673 type:complete len:195 (+) Transcript_6064:58-642(+)|eukprot:CAMPEP_0184307616 /NCGR_PEP_ID=MMETSP1049-20130417/16325_1 /TAXON_ID=77928 /ORGANISM="Proteomonas sulcata, Strain CCMP704" /LENGTH=194 /DNA_ID=CAMNT_0026620143 /DNA_START=40 /DNA_END=624 /DNA_ORIENTATION=+
MSTGMKLNAPEVSEECANTVVGAVRLVPNFPKPGLNFKDLSLLMGNPVAYKAVIDSLINKYRDSGIGAIVGIECRGFCFASPVALGLNVPFVPFRKAGKLPCKSVGVDFKLGAGRNSASFGRDRLEMHEDGLAPGSKVVIIDDMLGTGSTMVGACELVELVKCEVVECAVVVELPGLGGRENIKKPLFVLVEDV